MKEISVFDVIGPCMIGPSSSHTAGALRIALMARKMASHPVRRVHFILYGSFARTYRGHGTDRALLGGILGFSADDIRIRDSFALANEAGIEYSFETNEDVTDIHPNTVQVLMELENAPPMSILGESIGGGAARIRQIDGVKVDIAGELETIVITHKDEPGVLAHITEVLYKEKINIAYLTVYRESRHEIAYSVIEADGALPDGMEKTLLEVPFVQRVNLIKLSGI